MVLMRHVGNERQDNTSRTIINQQDRLSVDLRLPSFIALKLDCTRVIKLVHELELRVISLLGLEELVELYGCEELAEVLLDEVLSFDL